VPSGKETGSPTVDVMIAHLTAVYEVPDRHLTAWAWRDSVLNARREHVEKLRLALRSGNARRVSAAHMSTDLRPPNGQAKTRSITRSTPTGGPPMTPERLIKSRTDVDTLAGIVGTLGRNWAELARLYPGQLWLLAYQMAAASRRMPARWPTGSTRPDSGCPGADSVNRII
jgi:hypothetical protein